MTPDILERFAEAELDPARSKAFALRPPDRPAALPQTPSRVPRLRQIAFAAALGAAILIVGAVLLPAGDRDSVSPSGASALMTASANAAEQPPIAGVEYTRTHTAYTQTHAGTYLVKRPFTLLEQNITETWIRPDGSGRILTTYLPSELPTARNKRRAAAGSVPPASLTRPNLAETDQQLSAAAMEQELTEEDLPPPSELPTDPVGLKAAFQAEYTTDPSIERDRRIFQLATDVLTNPTASPDLRAAAYEVVAGLSEVDLKADVKDPAGRPTTAASITDNGGLTSTLYFDPDSSRVQAVTETAPSHGAEYGGAFSYSEVIEKVAEVSSLEGR